MTAKEIFKEFKKIAGKGRDGLRIQLAEQNTVARLAQGFEKLKSQKPPATDADLFALFDFMNVRANKVRALVNTNYKRPEGGEVMKPGGFNEILKAKAPLAWKAYQDHKTARRGLKIVK